MVPGCNNMSNSKFEEIIVDLRRSVAWMDLVLSNLHEGVGVLGKDNKLLFANDALGKMLSKNRIFLLGKSLGELIPELPETLYGQIDVSIGGQKLILEVVTVYVSKIEQTVVVFHDITQRENALREAKKINTFMVDRELDMIKLKKELSVLKKAEVPQHDFIDSPKI